MNLVTKALFFFGIYVFLHFGYEATGFEVLRPVFGTSESVFEHLKIGFFAYFFASLFEFALIRKHPLRPRGFWPSRILATWSIPWIMASVWYLAQAVTENPFSLFFELTWALAVTFLSGILGGIIERGVEDIWFQPGTKGVLLVLFLVSLVFFVSFTYRAPQIDLFAIPEPLRSGVGR